MCSENYWLHMVMEALMAERARRDSECVGVHVTLPAVVIACAMAGRLPAGLRATMKCLTTASEKKLKKRS